MSDQDRISPYNNNTISARQETWIKKNIKLGIITVISVQLPARQITRIVQLLQ